MVRLFTILFLTASLSACGFVRSVWNAEAPKRKTVELRSASLPAFSKIFSQNEIESESTLYQWRKSVTDSFRMIEGSRKNFLTPDEVRTIVLKGLIRLDTDPKVSAERALGLLEILGFKNGISLDDVEALFDWVKAHKTEARTFHDLILENTGGRVSVHAGNLIDLLNLFGSLVALGGDQPIQVDHLTDLLEPWIPKQYVHAKQSLGSGLELSVGFFASFCGDRVDQTRWNGKRIGQCLHDLTRHFGETAPVFEYMFGNLSPLDHPELLKAAADLLPVRMKEWQDGHNHAIFKIERVEKFSKDLQIPPPYAFVRMTEWIPKLNPNSTNEGMSPSFFIDLSQVVRNWIHSTLDATQGQSCREKSWKSCEFTGKYALADQLFNEEYATLLRTKTLGFVSQVALYDSLSQLLFDKLDTDHTGTLKGEIKDLLNIAIRLLDSNAFTQNVIAGVLEQPIDPQNLEDSLSSHARQGLSELAALAADILPARGQDRRGLLRKLEAQIYSREKQIPMTLDKIGITAFIYLYDLISDLRADYLTRYNLGLRTSGALKFVKRRKVIEALPQMLFDHFPRIYNECLKNSFERTCGVVFTEVLPDAPKGKDELETYELDIMTLTGILMESMMNRCDRNGDDALSTNVLDGNDEKTCMITISTALAKRLMKSNFIDQSNNVEFLLYLTNHFIFTRWAAKAAITRGTLKGVGWFALPTAALFTGEATLGSIMKLAAEIMDPEKVDAIEKNITGHIDTPGDELIYNHELTDHYLPDPNESPRYSRIKRLPKIVEDSSPLSKMEAN